MTSANHVEFINTPIFERDTISALLLQYFERKNIIYVLLNSNGHFYSKEDSLNIIISKENLKYIPIYIDKFCKQTNLISVQIQNYKVTECLFVLTCYDDLTKKFINLRVNFYVNYKVNGRLYLSSEELLHNRCYIPKKRYWKINDVYLFICDLIWAIENLSITHAQFSRLKTNWLANKDSILQKLKIFFNDDCNAIIRKACDSKDLDYLSVNLSSLKKKLRTKISKRTKDILSDKLLPLKRLLKPTGLVVGILGRDGCGKSTFVQEMTTLLGPYFKDTKTFKKFPSLFYKKEIFKKKEAFDHSQPHFYKERGVITSFIKLNIIFIEFLFGYWLKIFPLKTKSCLVLYDRYFIDILVDPLRYRIKGNRFFIKIFHYFLPKPDVWIILDLSSDVLLKRKQELSIEMAEKLRYQYLSLQHLLPHCIVINNEGEIEKTVDKASKFIFNYMQQRVAI